MPLEMNEFKDLLPSLGVDRLAEIAWIRAQEDDTPCKALMASVCLRNANGDYWTSSLEDLRKWISQSDAGNGDEP